MAELVLLSANVDIRGEQGHLDVAVLRQCNGDK
jgi:hypothetical protein